MAGTGVRYTSDDFSRIGNEMISNSEEFTLKINNLYELVDNHESWWAGKDAIAYAKAVNDYKEIMTAVRDQIRIYGKFLISAGNTFKEATKQLAESARGNMNLSTIKVNMEELETNVYSINQMIDEFSKKGKAIEKSQPMDINMDSTLNSQVTSTDKLYMNADNSSSVSGIDGGQELIANSYSLTYKDGTMETIRPGGEYDGKTLKEIIDLKAQEGKIATDYTIGYTNGEAGDYTKTIYYGEKTNVTDVTTDQEISTKTIETTPATDSQGYPSSYSNREHNFNSSTNDNTKIKTTDINDFKNNVSTILEKPALSSGGDAGYSIGLEKPVSNKEDFIVQESYFVAPGLSPNHYLKYGGLFKHSEFEDGTVRYNLYELNSDGSVGKMLETYKAEDIVGGSLETQWGASHPVKE